MKRVFLASIKVYQKFLSPFWPSTCRYYPSCSHYTFEAVERYGALKGVWLGMKRLGRCQPWGGSGYDPVPLPASSPGAEARPGAQRPRSRGAR